MKTLWIARHAESGHHEFDTERSLTSRGRAQAEEVGLQLTRAGTDFISVFCSSSARTQETCACWSNAPLWKGSATIHDSLYRADWRILLQCVCQTDNNISNLCILAHNPGVSDLIECLTQEKCGLNPGEVAQTTCNIKSWQELSADISHLVRIFRPNC